MQLVDAFTLNDEIDVAFARFDLLPQAEKVLISEGSHTHQGKPKGMALDGLTLPERVERIRSDLSGQGTGDEANWVREGLQREYLTLRLEAMLESRELSENALVISSDADELVDPLMLPHIYDATEQGPIILHMRMIYYGRWEWPDGWLHAKAFRLRDLPESLTQLRTTFNLPAMRDCGWHVSYRGDEDALRHKMECFAHQENLDEERWQRIRAGRETGLGPNGEQLSPLTPEDFGDMPAQVRSLVDAP